MTLRFTPAILAAALVVGPRPALEAQTSFTLADAVRRGLAFHPALAGATAAVDAADARYGEAGASRFPSLSLDATAVRFQEPMIVAPLHSFDPTRPPTFHGTLVQGRLGAAYTLFDGGARAGRRAQSRAGVDGARAQLLRTRVETITAIADAYLATLTGGEIHTAAARRLTSLRAERDRVALLVEAGSAAEVERLRIEAALAQGEADSVRAARNLETAERDLARQVGLEEPIGPAGLSPVRVAAAPPSDTEALLSQAVASNPDHLAAEDRAAAALAAERVARAARLPTVTLQAGYQTYGSGAGDFTAEWQAGLGIAYPIFSGGGRRHRIAESDAEAAAAEAQLATIDLQLAGEIDRALAQIAEARARIAALERAVDHLAEVVRIERLALETGAGVQTDFLRAEAELFDTRSSLAMARQSHVAGHVALAALLGTLSPEWIANQLENEQ